MRAKMNAHPIEDVGRKLPRHDAVVEVEPVRPQAN